MKKNKKVAISVLVFSVILGAGAYGISQTSAQGNGNSDTLIDKLVAKFNLNKDEVAQVFDENRVERRAQMNVERKSNLEERLNTAVTNGELTNEQKQLITNKLAELEKEREANQEAHANLSADQRKIEMEEHWAEMEKWASDNGIDVKYLVGGFGRGMGRGDGMGKGMGRGQNE